MQKSTNQIDLNTVNQHGAEITKKTPTTDTLEKKTLI